MNNILISGLSENSKIHESEIKEIVAHVLSIFELQGEVEIIFVGADEIKDLNEKHRRIAKPTDVLSFPQNIVPTAKYRVLGSLVICEDIVIEKNEEMTHVIKHGLLHLLGYDHETDELSWDRAAQKVRCKL